MSRLKKFTVKVFKNGSLVNEGEYQSSDPSYMMTMQVEKIKNAGFNIEHTTENGGKIHNLNILV